MAVTLKQIAGQLGIATSTVSMALNGKASQYNISKETVDKVRLLAKQTGYRANAGAKSLLSGKLDCIGVLSASLGQILKEPIYSEMFCSIQNLFHDCEINTMTLTLDLSKYKASVPKMIREHFVEGVIIAHYFPHDIIEIIKEIALPQVYVNMEVTGDVDTVNPDDWGGMQKAMKYLFELGHKRILYLGRSSKISHPSTKNRLDSYVDAMKNYGLTLPKESFGSLSTDLERVNVTPTLKDPGEFLYEQLCKPESERPTAVISYHDMWTGRVMSAIDAASLNVPSDISYMTFGQSEFTRHFKPSITHLEIPFAKMGELAAEKLFAKIRLGDKERVSALLPEELVIADSTGPAKY